MSYLIRRSLQMITPSRGIHLSLLKLGDDRRDKLSGHIPKQDTTAGERMPINHLARSAAIQTIDENLYNTIHDGMKFTDVPIIHIKCTRNNTKVSLAVGNGRLLGMKTAGSEGYKNCRKGTTVAAQAAARRVLILANDNNIKTVRLVLHGLGPGRTAAVKSLELSDLNVISITDRTPAAEPWTARPRAAKSL